MVDEGARPINERITENWGRLEKIGSAGQDIEKLKVSLAKIEKVAGSVPPADLDRALTKLEDFLTRIETKLSIEKEETEEEKIESGEAPPQEGSEEADVKVEEPQAPQKEETSGE